jgi:hypothetical protein
MRTNGKMNENNTDRQGKEEGREEGDRDRKGGGGGGSGRYVRW